MRYNGTRFGCNDAEWNITVEGTAVTTREIHAQMREVVAGVRDALAGVQGTIAGVLEMIAFIIRTIIKDKKERSVLLIENDYLSTE